MYTPDGATTEGCRRPTAGAFLSKPDQVLVVPPMALAWLTEAEGERIMVSFEARGHSDATVLFSSCRTAGRPRGHASNYTVIIGSHRNSCVKIEKDGVVVCQVQTREAAAQPVAGSGTGPGSPLKSRVGRLHPMQLDPDVFREFWVSYGHGEIRIGHGVDDGDAFCAWRDVVDGSVAAEAEAAAEVEALGSLSPEGGRGAVTSCMGRIRHVGLSSWNTHVGYRNVHVKTVVDEALMDEAAMDEAVMDEAAMDEDVEVRVTEMVPLVTGLELVQTEHASERVECGPPGVHGRHEGGSATSLLQSCLDTMKDAVAVETVCGYLIGLDRLISTLHRSNQAFLCAREDFLAFAATNFETLAAAHGDELCSLPSDVMDALVKHQAVACSEKAVYDMVHRWYEVNGPEDGGRGGGPFRILRHVRFPLMTSDELASLSTLASRGGNLGVSPVALGWNHALMDLVHEATEYQRDCQSMVGLYDPSVFIDGVLDGKLRMPSAGWDGTLRFRERSPIGSVNLVYMYDGDNNGVFQFVGTRHGTAPWTNPVAAGLISISSSSPSGRFCDPRALVGRGFSSLNFAGPRRSVNGGLESWWAIHLQHGLRCTRYVVRHDGSADHLRNWVFQGSADGMMWITLDEHSNDTTIRMPAQWASWPVRDSGRRKFRHFRILLTAPNQEAPNPMHLSLDHVELYGEYQCDACM